MIGAMGASLMASTNEHVDVNGREMQLRSAGSACARAPVLLFLTKYPRQFRFQAGNEESLPGRLLLFQSLRMLVEEPDGTKVVTDGQWRGDAEAYDGWLIMWRYGGVDELVMVSRQWYEFTKAGKHIIRVFCCAGDRVRARRAMNAEGQELEQLLGPYEWKSNPVEIDVMPCTGEALKLKASELLELALGNGKTGYGSFNWNSGATAPARALAMFGHSAAIGPLKEFYEESREHHSDEDATADVPLSRRLAMEGLLRIGTTEAIETLSKLRTLSRDEAVMKKELLGYVLSRTDSGDHHLSLQNKFESGAIDVAKRYLEDQGGDLLLRVAGEACTREPVLFFLSEYPRFRDEGVLPVRLSLFHSVRMLVEEPDGTTVVTDGQWKGGAEAYDGSLMTWERSVGGHPDELVLISRQWHDFTKAGKHVIRVFCCAGDRVQARLSMNAKGQEPEQLLNPYEWRSNAVVIDVVPCSDEYLEEKAKELMELSLDLLLYPVLRSRHGTRRSGQSLHWNEAESAYVYELELAYLYARALALFGHPAAIWPLEVLYDTSNGDGLFDPLARRLAMEGLLRIGTTDAIETLSILDTITGVDGDLKRKLLGYVLSRTESGDHHLSLQNEFESGAIEISKRFFENLEIGRRNLEILENLRRRGNK